MHKWTGEVGGTIQYCKKRLLRPRTYAQRTVFTSKALLRIAQVIAPCLRAVDLCFWAAKVSDEVAAIAIANFETYTQTFAGVGISPRKVCHGRAAYLALVLHRRLLPRTYFPNQ